MKFPNEARYALTAQIRRAALSVEANLAERFGRFHHGDRMNFVYLARSSLEETKRPLITARDLGYIVPDAYETLRGNADDIGKQINGIICSMRRPPPPDRVSESADGSIDSIDA